jgi:hypothetical protein
MSDATQDVSAPADGGESPRRPASKSGGGSGGGSYRPPLWSMSFGDPHGQWLHGDGAARSKLRCAPL